MMLLAQTDAPPIDGAMGWIIGLAVSSFIASASAIWSEYQRRSERKDKKQEQQTVAAITAEQDRTRLEFESVKNIIDDLREYNTKLVEQVNLLLGAVADRDASIRKRDESIAGLHTEINALRGEVATLRLEVKSLEASRDEALRLVRDRRAEETSPKT